MSSAVANHRRRQSPTRRQFLQAAATGAAGLTLGRHSARAAAAPSGRTSFLVIMTDQQSLDTLSAYGCTDLSTPNMDRLARGGYSFQLSYTANPLCTPARGSLWTGRMSCENGAVRNGAPIHASVPNIGQWLGREGYQTFYAGKWHLPGGYVARMPGFTVLPVGVQSDTGDVSDPAVSRICQGFFQSEQARQPFFLVASFLQPHDCCFWGFDHEDPIPRLPYPQIAAQLTPLPPNCDVGARGGQTRWTALHWQYYIWSYNRHVEMVDAEIGRVLDALDASGQADNTVVIFTSDHGDGRGRHQRVGKNYFFDEAAKVPLILSFPGRAQANVQDTTHLASGVDLVPTVCDYAGIAPPPHMRGLSLRPLVENRDTKWRDYVVAEVAPTNVGRMVRSNRYKYITYSDRPNGGEQFFDMLADPWEMNDLVREPSAAAAIAEHRQILADWEARLIKLPIPPVTPRTQPASRGTL